MDLIYREDAEALFRDARKELFNLRDKFKSAEEYDIRDNMLLNAEQMIHALPPVNPTKTGHWIERRSRATGHIESVCSECGAEEGYPYNVYCGNCGARMFEQEDEP